MPKHLVQTKTKRLKRKKKKRQPSLKPVNEEDDSDDEDLFLVLPLYGGNLDANYIQDDIS